jgi:proline iminopeptidase
MNAMLFGTVTRVMAAAGIVAAAGRSLHGAASEPLYQPGMVRAGQNLRAPLTPPPQPPDANAWSVETDVRLHHFEVGQGRTALIIHGGPGRPHLKPWPGLDPLIQSYRFVYYDQRGCGLSDRPVDHLQGGNFYQNMMTVDRALGLGAQIADIERIRRILGQDRLILIGHSFGGFLAAMYAAEFPQRVTAMVLVVPADVLVSPSPSGGLFGAVRGRLSAEQQGGYGHWMQRYFDFGTIFSKGEADLVALNDEFGRYYRQVTSLPFPEQGKPGGWITHAIYLSMGRQHDYTPALKDVTSPVLVIHGSKDLQPLEASQAYVKALPKAEISVIEGAEHFPFHTHPAQFAVAVGEFLDKIN